MPKRPLFMGVAIIVGGAAFNLLAAQEMTVTLGLKSGAINTGVHSELGEFLNTDWRTGLTAGGFASIDLGPLFVVQVDLLYSQRGFGFRMYEEVVGLIPGEVKVRSLETHLVMGIGLPKGERSWRPRLFAGPVFGFELSCKAEGSALGTGFQEDCHHPVLGLETHRRDSGIVFGGAIDIHLSPFTLIVDGRYAHGLRNLNAESGNIDDLESRAWSFTLGLGWPF